MNWLKRLLFCLCVFPSFAVAQTVAITSGEHAGFSRLTFELPADVTWNFGRNEDAYVFLPNNEGLLFDISRVFERIPKFRILDVKPRRNTIVIEVADNTHADIFELRDGRIAIDIKDGRPSPYALFEEQLSIEPSISTPRSNAIEIAEAETAEVETPPIQTVTDFPIVFPEDAVSGAPNERELNQPLLQLPEPDLAASERASELEELLLKQIGRAVSQGLLDADLPQRDDAVEFAAPTVSESSQEPTPKEIEQPQQERTHIQIQSSVDREKRVQNRPIHSDSHGEVCLDDNVVALQDWGGELAEGLELGAIRAAAIEEFDVPSAQGVLELVRYYLFLSFGAEARSALQNFGLVLPNHDILLAMSDIMDHGHSTQKSRLSGQFRCDGDVAFWSLVSMEKFEKGQEYNEEAVLATFSKQPLHIRRLLGPVLAERFLKIGNERQAKLIQNAIARADGEHGDAFELLNAELSLEGGDIAEATEALASLVSANGPLATEALLRLLNAHIARGALIDSRHIENAEALLVEHRGTPSENQLFQSVVRSWNTNGQAQKAIAHLTAIPKTVELSTVQRERLWAETSIAISGIESDLEFAAVTLRHASLLRVQTPNSEARLVLAERLLSLGFSQDALKLFATPHAELDTERSRLFSAKSNLAVGKPEKALQAIDGVATSEAQEIRAKAQFALNNTDSAYEALSSVGESADLDTYALLSERWKDLEAAENENLSHVAELVQSQPDVGFEQSDTPPSLETVAELLDLAQRTRNSLEVLLD